MMEQNTISGKNGGTLKRSKKGDPGNPGAGRPKGSLNSRTIISKWLKVKETIDNPITGNIQSLSQFDIIVIRQIVNAKTGDTRSFNAILDRLEGKATQAVELGNRDDKPLDFSISNLPNISREDLLKYLSKSDIS